MSRTLPGRLRVCVHVCLPSYEDVCQPFSVAGKPQGHAQLLLDSCIADAFLVNAHRSGCHCLGCIQLCTNFCTLEGSSE